jgi:hypothetical protein
MTQHRLSLARCDPWAVVSDLDAEGHGGGTEE